MADGRDLRYVTSGSTDVVVDKGCLDCFVSGEGQADVEQYLREVHAPIAVQIT